MIASLEPIAEAIRKAGEERRQQPYEYVGHEKMVMDLLYTSIGPVLVEDYCAEMGGDFTDSTYEMFQEMLRFDDEMNRLMISVTNTTEITGEVSSYGDPITYELRLVEQGLRFTPETRIVKRWFRLRFKQGLGGWSRPIFINVYEDD